MASSFNHIVTNDRIFFFLKAEYHPIMYVFNSSILNPLERSQADPKPTQNSLANKSGFVT
jgi:hypothetical protein